MADNYLNSMRKYIWVHLLLIVFILVVLIGGGTEFFYILFHFVSAQEEFGVLLIHRLLGMVFIVFFSMLIFSNLIITLSTTYISNELDFLMAHPVKRRDIFLIKFLESIMYSSWAFVLLSIPVFLAYGMVRKVGFWFYPKVFLLVAPFVVIPAGIGAGITMLIAAIFPARKARRFSVVLGILAVSCTVAVIKLLQARQMAFRATEIDYNQILKFLKVGSMPLSPSFWISQGLVAAGDADSSRYLYWLLMLTATAAMVVQICFWMIPKLYYRGWALTKESSAGRYGKKSPIFACIDWALQIIPGKTYSLVSKDLKTFWRDPTQWSQLIILFGLLIVYIANIKNAVSMNSTINLFVPKWKMIISFFNMGATCFVLSILTTRFVYPMLSLEGKQFWVVGLAPIKRTHVVWEKYWLCLVSSLLIAESLMLFSGYVLMLEQQMFFLSVFTIFLMTFGFTSLAVGLGAYMPNFSEDNPARIANGLGGTLNVVLSLSYIGISLILEVRFVQFLSNGLSIRDKNVLVIIALFFLLHALTIALPMIIGLRNWKRIEF